MNKGIWFLIMIIIFIGPSALLLWCFCCVTHFDVLIAYQQSHKRSCWSQHSIKQKILPHRHIDTVTHSYASSIASYVPEFILSGKNQLLRKAQHDKQENYRY